MPALTPDTGAGSEPAQVRHREIWTRLIIDPLAGPFGRAISRLPGVTPNRVTAVAAVVALGSAACFGTGQLRAGGALFILRFFLDVVDGVVARTQRASSARGAVFDLAADVAGIGLNFAALAWYLAGKHELSSAIGYLLLAAALFYNWILTYRKAIAASQGLGDGGVMGRVHSTVPLLRAWIALSERLNMSPVPWAVEAEILALGLGPLCLPRRWVWLGLALALAFYAVADLVNLRRVLALTGVSEGGGS